jgi:hypothetical protein
LILGSNLEQQQQQSGYERFLRCKLARERWH